MSGELTKYEGVSRYIRFWHAGSKRGKDDYLAAGGAFPGFSLHAGGMLIPLGSNTITLSVFSFEHLLIQTDNAGKIVKAYRKSEFPGSTKKNAKGYPEFYIDGNPKKFDDNYIVLGLLWTPDSLFPVTANCFRGPSARGVQNLCNNVSLATDAARWAVQGPGFKDSAKAGMPAGRVLATCTLTPEKSVSSGMVFVKGNCVVRPTNAAEVERFNALSASDVFKADLLATNASWDRQVAVALGEVTTEDEEV